MKNNEQQHWITTDLPLAAALVTIGHRLATTDKSDPKRVTFLFEKDINLDFNAERYWNNTLNVPAQRYANELRNLKNRLYE